MNCNIKYLSTCKNTTHHELLVVFLQVDRYFILQFITSYQMCSRRQIDILLQFITSYQMCSRRQIDILLQFITNYQLCSCRQIDILYYSSSRVTRCVLAGRQIYYYSSSRITSCILAGRQIFYITVHHELLVVFLQVDRYFILQFITSYQMCSRRQIDILLQFITSYQLCSHRQIDVLYYSLSRVISCVLAGRQIFYITVHHELLDVFSQVDRCFILQLITNYQLCSCRQIDIYYYSSSRVTRCVLAGRQMFYITVHHELLVVFLQVDRYLLLQFITSYQMCSRIQIDVLYYSSSRITSCVLAGRQIFIITVHHELLDVFSQVDRYFILQFITSYQMYSRRQTDILYYSLSRVISCVLAGRQIFYITVSNS